MKGGGTGAMYGNLGGQDSLEEYYLLLKHIFVMLSIPSSLSSSSLITAML